MREKGLRATGCNSAIRSINAYLKWAGSSFKIPQMKQPQVVLPTYSTLQLELLLGWKPKKVTGHRLSILIALLADTGCRIDEALSLSSKDIDFDNLLALLHGKGRKDRLVPMSLELRRRLFLFQRKTDAKEGLVFFDPTRYETGRQERVTRFQAFVPDSRIRATCSQHSCDATHVCGQLPAEGRKCLPSPENARPFDP